MYRTIPKLSRIIEERMSEREESRRRERLRNPKPTVKIPHRSKTKQGSTDKFTKSVSHRPDSLKSDAYALPQIGSSQSSYRKKRTFYELERVREIQRTNLILFDKMRSIFNHQHPRLYSQYNPPVENVKQGRRQREDSSKLAAENESLVRRIQATRSSYNFRKYDQEYMVAQEYVRRMCAKPIVLESLTVIDGIAAIFTWL